MYVIKCGIKHCHLTKECCQQCILLLEYNYVWVCFYKVFENVLFNLPFSLENILLNDDSKVFGFLYIQSELIKLVLMDMILCSLWNLYLAKIVLGLRLVRWGNKVSKVNVVQFSNGHDCVSNSSAFCLSILVLV